MKKNKKRTELSIEALEERKLMATTWGDWPKYLNMDDVFETYPWLNGGGNNVAVIDKGIDYFHPALLGNAATNTVSPRVINGYDWRDNDALPFPSESEVTDPTTAHATGVAGILVAAPYDYAGRHYQGILQDSKLVNLRTNRFDSQATIKKALQWVINNRVQYNITAINLTDFIGTGSPTPVYANELQTLWNAGVFIATPVANDWNNETNPHAPIGLPATDSRIFGTGGSLLDGTINPKTQRGPALDLLGPSKAVSLIYYTPSQNAHVYINGGEGNSWGTPHILGTAVLLQQIDPTITPTEIMAILQDSGVSVTDPDATGNYERLDMYAAVNLAYSRRDDIYDQGAGGNNDNAHATAIPLNGSNVGSRTGMKLLIGDPDYYTFNVTGPEDFDIDIDFAGTTAFPVAEVVDSNGDLIGNITEDGFSKRLTAGTYYIRVTSSVSLNDTYDIQINEAAAPPPTTPGEDGTYNGIVYDASNNLHFAWYDETDHQLKYAKRTGTTWGSTLIVDASAYTGDFVSLALDSTGNPAVAYYDSNNADLKFARLSGGTFSTQTVDSNKSVGYYPSLQFNATDKPVIAYYYKTGSALRFATGNSSSPSSWNVQAIDSADDVGRYPSLVRNTATGRWAIAYEDTTHGIFKYAEQTKTAWALTNVDDTQAGGGFISLAFDSNNYPTFSYYDAFNANLKFANYNGSSWLKTTVASKNTQGLYTNLFYDSGNPVIYYFNKSTNNTVAARRTGSSWTFEIVATGGGRHNHVTLNSDDYETFVFLNDATGNLEIADL